MKDLLTAVMDEQGHTLVRNWYESNILIRQDFANGDEYRYQYKWSSNNYYVDRVVITLPDHREQEISPAETVPDFIRTYR
jgi:hypothetical protein